MKKMKTFQEFREDLREDITMVPGTGDRAPFRSLHTVQIMVS
jgi:hypothetical protein